jgi:Fibronectin type III domain
LNIIVSVSDGTATASLQPFTLAVTAIGKARATLTWMPPSQNEDGTALTNLAGYRIYYGQSQGSYPNRVNVDGINVTSYAVENLVAGTYYFVMTAVNTIGVESLPSSPVTVTLN